MAYKEVNKVVDFGLKNENVFLDVRGMSTVRGQAYLSSGSYGSGVVVMERSLDGDHWFAMGTAQSFSADGISGLHDCQATGYIRLRVDVAGTANAKLLLAIAAWSEAPMVEVGNGR